jgi:hypothetical protein
MQELQCQIERGALYLPSNRERNIGLDLGFVFLVCVAPKLACSSRNIFNFSDNVQLLKNAVFWDVTQYGNRKNRRFGGI